MLTTFLFQLNFHLILPVTPSLMIVGIQFFLQYYQLVLQQAATAPVVPPFFGYPGNGGPGLCMSQPGIMASPEMYMASDVDAFAGGGFQISVPLSDYFFKMFAGIVCKF